MSSATGSFAQEHLLHFYSLKDYFPCVFTESVQQRSWGCLELFLGTSKVVTDGKVQITQRHFSFKKALFVTCVMISVAAVLLMWLHPVAVSWGGIQLFQKQASMKILTDVLRAKEGAYVAFVELATLFFDGVVGWTNYSSAIGGGVALKTLLGTVAKFVPGILLGVQTALIVGWGISQVVSFIASVRAERAHKEQGQESAKTLKETCREVLRGEKILGKYQVGPLLHKMLNYALLVSIVGLCVFHLYPVGGLLAGHGDALSVALVSGSAVAASWFWDSVAALFLKKSGKDILNKEKCRKKLYSLGVRVASDVEAKRAKLQAEIDQYASKKQEEVLARLADYGSDLIKAKTRDFCLAPKEECRQVREDMIKVLKDIRWLELLQPCVKHIID